MNFEKNCEVQIQEFFNLTHNSINNIIYNTNIDEDTVIAGCVGIAGSASIGKKCKIGGAAMILGHLSIADNTTISPGTMITKTIKNAGKRYTSITPFFEHDDWLKIAAKLKQFGKKYE